MATYERFKFALQNIEGTQWRYFELLANVFCAEEFPSLRPMAAEGGDDGMDASLFFSTEAPDVVLQFSVRKDWDTKIQETCRRLAKTAPATAVLMYATSQAVGAKANSLRKTVRDKWGIYLDIRDQEWFLTQRNRSSAVSAEAEAFTSRIAAPLLDGATPLRQKAQALDDLEAKAAFVYLGLQWEDDTREKGLTKLCFEAMVRAVLRDTTSEKRMSRKQVKDQIAKLLPAQHAGSREVQIDGALGRLAKVYIRHWKKDDEFCLTWDERQRLAERLAFMDSLDGTLRAVLNEMVQKFAGEDGLELTEDLLQESVERSRSVLERVLLERGEVFAEAVIHERGADVRFEDVEALVYADFAANPSKARIEPRLVSATVLSLMSDPPEEVHSYLRSLSDTYTLFAFMRETPDVQSAVVKIFSEGDIWLDTSVLLPLFAEDLLDSGTRAHGLMVGAAREAGLKLFVTDGVLEEIATHIHRSRGYYHALSRGDAYGSEPFLLSCYRMSGRSFDEYEGWLQTFAGSSRPEDDIADYLDDIYGISVQSLQDYVKEADPAIIAAVGEVWHEARDRRDERAEKMGLPPMDSGTRARLVAHDVENYVGVQMRRDSRGERRSAFGYKSWWLTLDGTAFRVQRELADRVDGRVSASPAISPDFMLHYLAIGPVRARLSKKTEEALPLMLNMSILDAVPRDLLDLSDALRKELTGLPAHVVRRKIRDTLDEARMLLGAQARAGEQGLTDEIKERLLQQARVR